MQEVKNLAIIPCTSEASGTSVCAALVFSCPKDTVPYSCSDDTLSSCADSVSTFTLSAASTDVWSVEAIRDCLKSQQILRNSVN